MDNYEGRIRVFISYSRQDRDLVRAIADILRAYGLEPMWDDDFSSGAGFREQIRSYIAHAHVLLAVITEASGGWVQQEIGYAMALNIPVLPMVIGEGLPPAMLQQLLAVKVDDQLTGLKEQLAPKTFQNLVDRYRGTPALYECAPLSEDRANMLARFSAVALSIGMAGRVRQKGGLSSFQIPAQNTTHEVWDQRYGQFSASMFSRELVHEERRCLVEHAKAAGCRIIIDPSLEYAQYGPEARRVRLQCLVDFLESGEVADVQVAFDTRMSGQENVLIVGDLFQAEAVSAGAGLRGYRKTIFTRHAPTIAANIREFDESFDELIEGLGWSAESSRRLAAEHVKRIIETLGGADADKVTRRLPASAIGAEEQPIESKQKSPFGTPRASADRNRDAESEAQPDTYDVFISAKSADNPCANQVYAFLKKSGLAVFFSPETLPDLGNSDYRKEIDEALDQSRHMVVVTSSRENVMSSWVEAEWGSFINEKRAGRKPGNLITIVTDNISIEDLPNSLRNFQVFPFRQELFETLLPYVRR